MKKTQKQVNSIIHKGKNKDIIMCIETAKGFESDPHCRANCFNDYFISVAKNLSLKYQNQTKIQTIPTPVPRKFYASYSN